MNNMREQFERLPEIAGRIKKHSMFFDENKNQYGSIGRASDTQKVADINFVGGSWLMYQQQQKKIDDLTELNRLKTIALQQSVNRTSIHVYEKIVALENKLRGC